MNFLDSNCVLVFAFHVVDVVGYARHGRQGHDDIRIAAGIAIAVLNDILQQQVIFEYALHRLE